MTSSKRLFSVGLSVVILASQVVPATAIEENKTVQVVAQSAYQTRVWTVLKQRVPKPGDKKSLLCVFSKTRNLAPYNLLLEGLYRDSFGDGIANTVGDFLRKNSHDFTYQFHMQRLKNGAVRIQALDTRDTEINHNYVVDFNADETYNFVSYGKLPPTAQSQDRILQIYKRFLPSALQRRCLQSFQYLER